MTMVGETSCQWKQFLCLSFRSHKHKYTLQHKTLKAQDIFLYQEKFLFGSDSANPTTFEPGVHTFDFSFDLPSDVPGSFWSEIGSVSYSIEGKLITGFEKTSYSTKSHLRIVENIAMESNVLNFKPLCSQASKKVGIFLSKHQPLTVAMKLSKDHYESKENLEVIISISNKSNAEIKRVVLSLVEQMTLKSKEPHVRERTVSTVLEKNFCDDAQKLCEGQLKMSLILPELRPVRNSELIKVSYEIHACVVLGAFHTFPVLKLRLK